MYLPVFYCAAIFLSARTFFVTLLHFALIVVAGKDRREVRNYYKHRTDCLLSRILHCNTNQVVEAFAPGRPRALKGILNRKLTRKKIKCPEDIP